MRKWTENQLKAITVRDRDVCVAAGAGSGKTGVLVERFLRIIRDGSAPDLGPEERTGVGQILVITFTEKATKEMKGRIVDALTEAGLTEQRREVETAYISTIHGFCSLLLKENPFEAGVDPQFQVLEENEALRLLRNAVEDAVERAFEERDEEIIELVVAAQDERLFGTDISDPLAALAESVRAVLGKVRAAGWRIESLREHLDRLGESSASRAAEMIIQARERLLDLRRDLLACGAGVYAALGAAKQALLSRLDELDRAEVDGSWSSTAAVAPGLADIAKLAQSGTKALQRARTGPPDDRLRQTLEEMKAAAESARGLFEIEAEREETAALLTSRFWRLLLRSWEQYDAAKRSAGSLDNDDLQSDAAHLLRTHAAVRERYRRRFRHLLVDELQDTSPLQMELLSLLHDGAGNRLFLVGDVQQSIYGFRNADPGLFRDVSRLFHREGAGEYVTLAENFRSRPEILAFINGLFTQIWHDSDPPFMALTPGLAYEPAREPAVELLLTRDPGRAQYVPMEAAAIARRIRELVCPEDGPGMRYRDIAVLLRALTDIEKYETAFRDAGIPYYIEGGGRGYYARFEIRDVLNTLTALETPLNDVAVAAVLRSPLFGVSADALFRLAQFATHDGKRRALYKQLEPFACAYPEDAEAKLILDCFRMMERLRAQQGRLAVAELLESVIAETNLDARLLVRPNGRRRLANVRKLLQMAYASPSQTVGEFIRRLRDIEKLTDREGDAPTEEEASEVVRIMTIHKAKGLEFSVVFLADLARGMGGGERGLFACEARGSRHMAHGSEHNGGSGALRLGAKVGSYADFEYREVSEARQKAELDESFRVLYVAMTRARERLILCGSTQQGRRRRENWADAVFPTLGVLAPPEETCIRPGPDGVSMRVASMG